MKTRFLPLLLLLLPFQAQAAWSWHFAEPIAVTDEPKTGVFHHLDSAGRKNIALSGNRVAVTWEDNRDGRPRVYAGSKSIDASTFDSPTLISGEGDAYEPAIAGLGEGRFALVWEEDNAVFARIFEPNRLGPSIKLSTRAAGHISVDAWNGQACAAWRERQAAHPAIHVSQLRANEAGKLSASQPLAVEFADSGAPQLYPSIAVGASGLALAWEDRRAGHTRLLYSHSRDGRQFSPPGELNEFLSNRNAYDKGNGVTRVALARFGDSEVAAVWMDKRRSGKGYAIYASLGSEGGKSYGPNERVQGSRGDELPHYNPAVAGNSDGAFVVAWDDYRNGTSDIWLSDFEDLAWSDDFAPPPASGPGEQSNPSIAMDDEGGIHLVWIERSDMGEPTRIWYAPATAEEM